MDRELPQSPQRRRRQSPVAKGSLDHEVCPKCGGTKARIIGRSETFAALYLRCDECSHTTVAPA